MGTQLGIQHSHNAFAAVKDDSSITSPEPDADSPAFLGDLPVLLPDQTDNAPSHSFQAIVDTSFAAIFGPGSDSNSNLQCIWEMLVDDATIADQLLHKIRMDQLNHVERVAAFTTQVTQDVALDRRTSEQTCSLIELNHQLTANRIQQLQRQIDQDAKVFALTTQHNDKTLVELQLKVDQVSTRLQSLLDQSTDHTNSIQTLRQQFSDGSALQVMVEDHTTTLQSLVADGPALKEMVEDQTTTLQTLCDDMKDLKTRQLLEIWETLKRVEDTSSAVSQECTRIDVKYSDALDDIYSTITVPTTNPPL